MTPLRATTFGPAGATTVVAIVVLLLAARMGVVRDRRRRDARARCRAGAERAAAATGPLAASERMPRPSSRRPITRWVAAWRSASGAIGAWARRAAGRPSDLDADLRVGRSLLAVLIVLALARSPIVAAGAGIVVWAVPVVRSMARRSRDRAQLVDEAPEVIDLLRLGIGSGLNVHLAIEALTRHHHGRISSELAAVLDRAARGERLADALDAMAISGDAVQPLVDALVATERYGAPLVASLDRVAADARSTRRRRREEAARRVPVKLLFPLVFCTLPAFALLTVVPVLLRSLPSLAP